MLTEFEDELVCDRLEGWELAEFLQVPISDFLAVCYEYDWINDDNIDDVREFVGLKSD